MHHFIRGRRSSLAAALLSMTFLLSGVLVPQPVLAAGGVQGNLTGTVLDASNGKPLADVRITAQSPSGATAAPSSSRKPR